MSSYKKKIACLLLAAAMAASVLSACSQDQGNSSGSSSDVSEKEEKVTTTWKDNTEPIDLNVYLDSSGIKMDIWGTEHASQTVTKETGINLIIDKPTADDSQRINMLIASDDLPDLIIMDKNSTAWEEMIKKGQLNKMNELIEKYAPALGESMDPAIMENNKYEDGNVYRIPNFIETPSYLETAKKYNGLVGLNQPTMLMRQDYYEEIGKPSVNTPEKLTDALVKLKELHPDKIGFYAGCSDWQSHSEALNVYFGIAAYYKDGENVHHYIEDPKTREMYMWMNDLALKGLMGKESFVDSSDVATGKISQGLPICFKWTVGSMGQVPADNPDTTYEPIEPFDSYQQYRTGTGWFALGIPVKSEHADRAIQLLEYTNSEQGAKALCWGIEGEEFKSLEEGAHYHMVDGQPQYLQEYIDARSADSSAEQKTGIGPHFQLIFDSTNMNIANWIPGNEKMDAMSEVFNPLIVYDPKMDIQFPAASEELVTKTKLNEIIKECTVKIVFADSAEKASQEFDAMMERLQDAGLESFDKYVTEQYNK